MQSKDITCKLTGSVGPGVKAHIVPKAFHGLKDEHRKFRDGGYQLIMEGENLEEFKCPVGICDQSIVTAEGEKQFESCDNYAAKFFLEHFDEQQWKLYKDREDALILGSGSFNGDAIRRFCMTVLWRAHASDQRFYSQIQLGPHEERLRRLILEGKVGDPDDFSVILWGWRGIDRHKWPLVAPQKRRLGNGLRFYDFRTTGVNFTIKVDTQKAAIDPSIVGMDSDLMMFYRKPEGGSETDRRFIKLLSKRYTLKPL